VKEAIFNLVGSEVRGARVLDLCAGSGALGIEALSRGAGHVTFVERADRQVATIHRNLSSLGYAQRAVVARVDVGRWLEKHPEEVAGATLVLLDPPYNDPVLARALRVLDRLCGSRATVVVEHGVRQPLPPLDGLQVERSRRYGDTQVCLLRAPE
jgi:16S rRNA (guanine966-N2)-methyltransferase